MKHVIEYINSTNIVENLKDALTPNVEKFGILRNIQKDTIAIKSIAFVVGNIMRREAAIFRSIYRKIPNHLELSLMISNQNKFRRMI